MKTVITKCMSILRASPKHAFVPTLCLDFDGVVHSYTSGWQGARNIPDPPVPGALAYMAAALDAGWVVAIHSSRGNYWGGRRAMRQWLRRHAGMMFYDTPGSCGLEDVKFPRFKPSALVTIDDRAITFQGMWPSLDGLRQFKTWQHGGPTPVGFDMGFGRYETRAMNEMDAMMRRPTNRPFIKAHDWMKRP